jgi:thymidylate kinase
MMFFPNDVLAVSGAQGVGKSTFCADLKGALLERWPGRTVEIRTRVARGLKDIGISSDQQTEEDHYPLYLERHIENLLTVSSADYVILERTLLDTLAYATLNANMRAAWMDFCLKLGDLLASRIRWYFFLPIEFSLQDDGTRCVDVEYQARLEDTMLSLIRRSRPDVSVVRGSRAARVDQAMRLIEQSRDT